MTSLSGGYVTVRRNLSNTDPIFLWRNLPILTGDTVMVSVKDLTTILPIVSLFDHHKNYSHTDSYRKGKGQLWTRRNPASDFAQLFNITTISIRVERNPCVNRECFRLHFSFFQSDKRPRKLANGYLNCSVPHYATFHQHLACNLKPECEDGRDETGHCPYSSAQCLGLVAMCGRCFQFVKSLHDFVSDKTDFKERADDYCNSLGGMVSFPKCVLNWHDEIRIRTGMHPERLEDLWTSLSADDLTLPNMYIRSVTHRDRTVLHHSIPFISSILGNPKKKCLKTPKWTQNLHMEPCVSDSVSSLSYGAFCEFLKNETERRLPNSKLISFNRIKIPVFVSQQLLIKCLGGHVTHILPLCGSPHDDTHCIRSTSSCLYPDGLSLANSVQSTDFPTSPVPLHTCDDGVTQLSSSLLCDFIEDCPDSSDETFFQHPVCTGHFACDNGQCLPFDNVCDLLYHCRDQSDETHCNVFRKKVGGIRFAVPSPVLIRFDGISEFVSIPMNSTETCPDSHYRCPGELNDCLPVYTRCNEMYDCLGHQDEHECEEVQCPGFFRCRLSSVCLHGDHLCDGWPHCPLNDDELWCEILCPENCLCQGHTFWCPQPFEAAFFPQLRYLNATGSGMGMSEVRSNSLLVTAIFALCSLVSLHPLTLGDLRLLDLSNNQLQQVNLSVFLGLASLETLSLSNNPVSSLYADSRSRSDEHKTLLVLDLSQTQFAVFSPAVLAPFSQLHILNLSFTPIHTINPPGFQFNPSIKKLYMKDSPIRKFPRDVFKDLFHLRFISTENYKLCCQELLPFSSESLTCSATKDEISSCEDLLRSWTYRGFLWFISCLSMAANFFCCTARVFSKSVTSSSGYSVFVLHLTLADFLMGVYIVVIGAADERFRGRYLHEDDTWKHSATCRMAGFLSLVSSEVSALVIWLITVDRFLVLRFPFSTLRFSRLSATLACLFTWLAGCLLALLPLLPIMSHWEFYSQTGICIPLPVTRRDFKGRMYSVSVLILLNFVVFLFVAAGQACIYWSIKTNSLNSTNSTTKALRDVRIAWRLITVALTDFACWFPIGLCGILALAGTPIPGEVNVALAVFVLPLNSAVNPFVYTLNSLAEKRKQSDQEKLLQWLQTHPELIAH